MNKKVVSIPVMTAQTDAGSKSFSSERTAMSRRRFLRTTAQISAGIAIAGGMHSALALPRNKRLPNPNRSGIEHVVVVMMENRSFDHFLGWLPGANRMQGGLTYVDGKGVADSTPAEWR